jgi:hypothetical protein
MASSLPKKGRSLASQEIVRVMCPPALCGCPVIRRCPVERSSTERGHITVWSTCDDLLNLPLKRGDCRVEPLLHPPDHCRSNPLILDRRSDRALRYLARGQKLREAQRLGACANPAPIRTVCLGGHLKTGHTWTLQKRPTERNQNKIIYTLRESFGQTFFRQGTATDLY